MAVGIDWTTARAEANAEQAAYFRQQLATDRDEIAEALELSRGRLRQSREGHVVVGLGAQARMRQQVRDLESRLRELDRMLDALGRRFPDLV